jgi:hypothetical protein
MLDLSEPFDTIPIGTVGFGNPLYCSVAVAVLCPRRAMPPDLDGVRSFVVVRPILDAAAG